MTDRCLACSSSLPGTKGTIRKWKIGSLASPNTIRKVFGRDLERKGHVCPECRLEVVSKTVTKKNSCKRRWHSPKTSVKRRGVDAPDTSHKRPDTKVTVHSPKTSVKCRGEDAPDTSHKRPDTKVTVDLPKTLVKRSGVDAPDTSHKRPDTKVTVDSPKTSVKRSGENASETSHKRQDTKVTFTVSVVQNDHTYTIDAVDSMVLVSKHSDHVEYEEQPEEQPSDHVEYEEQPEEQQPSDHVEYEEQPEEQQPSDNVEYEEQPEEQPMSVEPEQAPKISYKNQVIKYIKMGRYEKAFKLLLNKSSFAEKAFLKVYSTRVKQEVKNVRRGKHLFTSLIGPISDHRKMENVQWDAVVSQGRELTPFLAMAFDNALPPTEKIFAQVTTGNKGEKRSLTSSEKETRRDAMIGMMYSMTLYTHRPAMYNLIPSIMGVQMWFEGASLKTFRYLNYFSISQSKDSVSSRIDSLREGHKDHLLSLKSSAENSLAVTRPHLATNPAQSSVAVTHPHLAKTAGYSFCVDRVQFTTQSQSHKMTMAFAAEHRVKPPCILASTVSMRRRAEALMPQTFIPTPHDFEVLKDYMIVVVKRTVLSFLPALKPLQSGQKTVVCHEHTDAMKKKSNILNLGILEGNPSTIPDTINILDHLKTYVPNDTPNASFAVPVHCKVETIETIIKAKKERSLSENETPSFRNLLEVGQEYHKEGLLMEDALKMHLSDTSRRAHGSLCHVKAFLKLWSNMPPVMPCFKNVWTLLQRTTEGLIVLLAMKLLDMTSIDEVPEDLPDDRILQNNWLDNISAQIVDYIWKQPSSDEIKCIEEGYKRKHTLSQDADDSEGNFPFCFCNEDREDEMVRCCNSHCQIALVHYQCCRPPLTAAPVADWYCSDECEESPHYIYCFCQETQDGADMIQCHSQDKCLRYEWYHLSCLDLTSDELPDEWYCSDKCALGEEHDDAVLEYTKSLLWTGLNLLVRRDIVREGNGPLMLQMWRLDILQFWQNHHDTYLKMAHRLLAYTGGFLPPAVAYDITWNRVVNVEGQKGSNIGMDLQNEFLKSDFKEMLQHGDSQFNTTRIKKFSQMGGAFKLDLHRILIENSMFEDSESLHQHQHTYTTTEQIQSFVQEYQGDALFDYCPPREHKGFSGFRHSESLTSPYKLGGMLKLHSLELDQ